MPPRQQQLLAYALATLAQAGAGVLMMPLLARTLARPEFGTWALLEPALLLAVQIGLFGADYGIVKLVGHDGVSPRAAFLGLARTTWLTSLCAGAAMGLGAACWWQSWYLGSCVAWAVCAEALYMLSVASLRGANHAGGFAAGAVTKAATLLGLAGSAATLGWPVLHTLADVVVLYACASTVGLLVAAQGLYASTTRPEDQRQEAPQQDTHTVAWKNAARYGLPLLGAGLLASVVGMADRYVVGLHLGVTEVASYAVAAKLANLLNLLANPVNLWFPAARFQHIKDPDDGQAFFHQLSLQVTYGYLGLGVLMWLATPLLLPWFAPGFEWSALTGALLVAATVCFASSPPFNIGLLKAQRTRWNLVITMIVAAFQVTALLALVPWLGAPGAAVCTLLAQALSLVLQHAGSQRTHRLRWPYRRLALMTLTAPLLGGGLHQLGTSTSLAENPPLFSVPIFALCWLALGWYWLPSGSLRLGRKPVNTAWRES